MKKLFALLAVAIGVVACQKDQADFGVNLGGEQETTINVALPEETRADSALSGLDNGVLADHDLRFILEIYSGDQCVRQEKIVEDGITSASFNVRVVPKHEYDFVVWADFVKNDVDTYYNTHTKDANGKDLGLQNISIIDDAPMTEARDAFYGKASLGTEDYVANMGAITLKRPFAKIRVIADDVVAAKNVLHKNLTAATVTYKNDVTLYNTFDARNKAVSVSGDVSKVKSINYTESQYDESNLYVDYLLVPQGEQSIVKFDLEVAEFVNKDFSTDIAVEANKLTTIKGDILTNGSDIKVEIEDGMAAETIYLEGNVTLTEDLVVNKSIVVRQGATAVLNLNNHNIKVNNNSEELGEGDGIIVYGDLTIEGNGTVEANTRAVWARKEAGAKVTINGGHFIGSKYGSEVIYASGKGQIVINGGTFEAVTEDQVSFAAPQYAVLNLHGNGKDGCNIVVKGGSFKNFNPADNVSENPKKNFCAEGCVSVANGEWFDVIYDPYYGYTKVSNVGGLKDALTDNSVEKIYLAAGEYDLNDKIYYLTSKKELIAEVADNTLVKGKIVADGADLTATNIKFGSNDMSIVNLDKKVYGTYVVDNYSAIITLNYAAGTFNNCIFNGDGVVAINYFQDKAGKVLNVNECTFVDTLIYSKVLCNITNNTFNLGEIPYGICVWPRPAGSTNSICYFVNNTLNSTYFPTENLAYCQVMLLSQSAPYANLEFNIQGNSGSKYTVGWTNSVIFKNDGSVTFADGSKTFNFPKLVD